MTPDERMKRIAAEAEKGAAKLRFRQGSYARKHYANGVWQVAVDVHPEIAPLRPKFLRLVNGD